MIEEIITECDNFINGLILMFEQDVKKGTKNERRKR